MAEDVTRRLASQLLRVALVSCLASAAQAQETPKVERPAGMKACALQAYSRDPDPAGLNVRAAPNGRAPILGKLPHVTNAQSGSFDAIFEIIGAKDGWLLIKGAKYDPDYGPIPHAPKLYSGAGWVAGSLVGMGLLAHSLKSAPRDDAPDVVSLSGFDDSGGGGPQDVAFRSLLDCDGEWYRVELPLKQEVGRLKPLTPSDGPTDAVRGWGRGECVLQLTTCN